MSQSILIVEDEPKIAQVLIEYLTQYGQYECKHIDHGDEVLPYLESHSPDLIVLDVMLPGKDGLSLAKTIAGQWSIPFVMITARVEEIDRLLGLELGADDYICKPFSPREVVVRIRNILRRSNGGERFTPESDLKIDRDTFTATIADTAIKLTPVEFGLLAFLAEKPGHVYSRNQLMETIYADYRVVSDRTIDTHVKNVRKKLGNAAPGKDFIESVYGVGYRFTGS